MNSLNEFFTQFQIATFAQVLALIVIGYLVARLISNGLNRAFKNKLSLHQGMLLRRVIFYAIFLLFVTSAIQQLGFNITALLGATGILTVALGIASQTSMSNMISGFFIIGEKPFEIGDTIKVNENQGEVIAIDYLSVKIRTPDNIMIRIPNEILVKSPITNISYFPLRRIDLTLTLPYKTDLNRVKTLLLKITAKNPLCLTEPKPAISILGFTEIGLNIQFSVWSEKDKFNELKNSLQAEINQGFIEHKIDLSMPSHVLTFSDAEPVSIKLMSDNSH